MGEEFQNLKKLDDQPTSIRASAPPHHHRDGARAHKKNLHGIIPLQHNENNSGVRRRGNPESWGEPGAAGRGRCRGADSETSGLWGTLVKGPNYETTENTRCRQIEKELRLWMEGQPKGLRALALL